MAHNETQRRMKRLVAMSYNDIERALDNLQELNEAFGPVHPGENEGIEVMAQALLQVQELLKAFWGVCWGTVPETFEGYR